MGNVVCYQVSLIKTTIWAALHHLFPGAFFFLPHSKHLPLIALSADVSGSAQKGSTRLEYTVRVAFNTHTHVEI